MDSLNQPYNILSWNVRGLNNAVRQQEIKQVIISCRPDLVCTQESKMERIDAIVVRNTLGPDFDNNFAFLPAIGTKGGVSIAAKLSLLTLQNLVLTNHTVSVKVVDSRFNDEWMITGVYGPQGSLDKKMFIRELKRLKQAVLDKRLLLGDFNLIYKDENKSNNRLNRRLMLRFRRALNYLEVKEVELTGRKFTWSNGQEIPTLLRIDRVFCIPQWEEWFPNRIMQTLSSSISDHCPHPFNFSDLASD
jgi:exonuclease III